MYTVIILLKNCHGELFKVKVGEVRFTSFVKVKVIEMTCTCIFRVQLFLKEEFNLVVSSSRHDSLLW